MKYSYPCMNALYLDLLNELLNEPRCGSKGTGGNINELLFPSVRLLDTTKALLTLPKRKFSMRYLAGELAFYFSGSDRLDFIGTYSKFWSKISDDGRTVNSCYGKRIFKERSHNMTQYEYAMENLLRNRASKNAIVLFYDKRDTNTKTKDNCCTMYMQFFIRNNVLIGKSFMRSNDIWFGLPYDIFFFTLLLNRMRFLLNKTFANIGEAKIEATEYYHEAGSLHLYERNADAAFDILYHSVKTESPSIDWTEETEEELPLFLYLEEQKRSRNLSLLNERLFSSPLWRLCVLALNEGVSYHESNGLH